MKYGKQKNKVNTFWNSQKSIENIETDIMDYDGIGNYGRIPDKKPKKL